MSLFSIVVFVILASGRRQHLKSPYRLVLLGSKPKSAEEQDFKINSKLGSTTLLSLMIPHSLSDHCTLILKSKCS